MWEFSKLVINVPTRAVTTTDTLVAFLTTFSSTLLSDDHENDPTQNLTPPVKTEFVPTKSGDKFRYKKCSFKTGLNV